VNISGVYRIQKYLIIPLATVDELGTDGRRYYFLPLNGGVPEPTVALSTKLYYIGLSMHYNSISVIRFYNLMTIVGICWVNERNSTKYSK
jgi:hypothetical protein